MAEIQIPTSASPSQAIGDLWSIGPPPSAPTDGFQAADARAAAAASLTGGESNGDTVNADSGNGRQAIQSGGEAGSLRSSDFLSGGVGQALELAAPDPLQPRQSAVNLRAFSEASSALAKGGQAGARAWFDLSQTLMCRHLEMLGELSACRSVRDLILAQTNLLRSQMEHVIECGDVMSRTTTSALLDATCAIRPSGQRA